MRIRPFFCSLHFPVVHIRLFFFFLRNNFTWLLNKLENKDLKLQIIKTNNIQFPNVRFIYTWDTFMVVCFPWPNFYKIIPSYFWLLISWSDLKLSDSVSFSHHSSSCLTWQRPWTELVYILILMWTSCSHWKGSYLSYWIHSLQNFSKREIISALLVTPIRTNGWTAGCHGGSCWFKVPLKSWF